MQDGDATSVSMVVRASARYAGSSHTSDFTAGTLPAALPDAWRYGVCARTDWPGVSLLWCGQIATLICNCRLRVATRVICLGRSVLEIQCVF